MCYIARAARMPMAGDAGLARVCSIGSVPGVVGGIGANNCIIRIGGQDNDV